MSLDHIRNFHFNGLSQGLVSRRLSKLAKSGLIGRKSQYISGRNRSLFESTEFGLKEIKEYLLGEVKFRNYKSDSILHDLELVEIAQRLKQLNLVKRINFESELTSYSLDSLDDDLLPFSALNSDLAVELYGEDKDELVAFEYERTSKSKKRNSQKLKDYYIRKSIKAVFYICENKAALKSLSDTDNLLFDEFGYSKIYFCLKEEFYNREDQIIFSRFDGKKITIL